MPKKPTGLVSLAYSDSENEEDESVDDTRIRGEHDDEDGDDSERHSSSNDDDHDDYNRNGDDERMSDSAAAENEANSAEMQEDLFFEDIYGDKDITIVEFHESLRGKAIDDIRIPYPTRQMCPENLQRRIEAYYEKVQAGSDLNKSIQKRKDLRNPSIYEKMISYCQINEMATNYPKEIYDPEPFLGSLSYYEELSRLQKEEMEKRERDRKEASSKQTMDNNNGTNVSGKKGDGPSEKRTKWDSAPPSASTSSALASALSKAQNIIHSNKKPQVISAFGTINKKR